MTYQDWLDWKSNPVTKAFHEVCEERVEEFKELLSNVAGTNQNQDNFYRGIILAYREMLEFKVEE